VGPSRSSWTSRLHSEGQYILRKDGITAELLAKPSSCYSVVVQPEVYILRHNEATNTEIMALTMKWHWWRRRWREEGVELGGGFTRLAVLGANWSKLLAAARRAAEPRVTEVLRKHVHGLQILGHRRCRERSGPANLWTKVEF
jgi:hypothetical protein